MKTLVKRRFAEINTLKDDVAKDSSALIVRIAKEIIKALKRKKKILIFGNGGSAADSQHIAAELIGRYQKERKAYPAVALTTDTSILTALSNDYGFDCIFARQIEGIGKPGDIALAISTSGSSKNIIEGVKQAKKMGLKTIVLTGCNGGKLAKLCDLNLTVPSYNTARVQEVHICVAHIISELVENNLSQR